MGRKVICLFFVQALIVQTFTATLHPTIRQYLNIAGLAPTQFTTRSLPVTISKQPNLSSISSIAALANLFASGTPVIPKTQSITPSALLAALSESYQTIPSIPTSLVPVATPEYSDSSSSNQVDASLLNNLAIAMQLLIMSNLLNSPPQETGPEPVVVPAYPLYEKTEPVTPVSVSYAQPNSQPATAVVKAQPTSPNQAYYPSQYEPQQPVSYPAQPSPTMPNANFVGASTFADSSSLMGIAPPASSPSPNRSGFALMSPYEALSPSSPFSDPILSSPYGSIMTSKKDTFQSPYSAIMASENKDLFSMSDFF